MGLFEEKNLVSSQTVARVPLQNCLLLQAQTRNVIHAPGHAAGGGLAAGAGRVAHPRAHRDAHRAGLRRRRGREGPQVHLHREHRQHRCGSCGRLRGDLLW